MKVQNTFVLFLAATARLVGACSVCPSLDIPPLTFDQSCQNTCSTGAETGALVGPGVLSSGDASTYDVAAFYFGYQS